MNFEPEQLLITQAQQVPVVAPPPVPETEVPETPKVDQDPPCPGPNALRIGDIGCDGHPDRQTQSGIYYIDEVLVLHGKGGQK